MPPDGQAPSARALLVGVGSTSYRPSQSLKLCELPGVARDIETMRAALAERQFNVAVPTGTGLTCQEVRAAIERLVTTTCDGDLSVIYLSGHGVQIPDHGGDEADGWDEAFVCSDGLIPDDWFWRQVWPCAPQGAAFVVVVDACHGASMTTRAQHVTRPPVEVTVRRPRNAGHPFPTGTRGVARVPAPASGVLPARPGPQGSDATPASKTYYRLTLAACPDAMTAVETAGRGGAVTSALLQTLRTEASPTYRALWSRVATIIRDQYHQDGVGTPQIDSLGPDDRLLDAPAFVWPLP